MKLLQDVTLIILAFCAVISLLVGLSTDGLTNGWYDSAGIAFSIIIVVLVTATSDYQQSLQVSSLQSFLSVFSSLFLMFLSLHAL